MKKLVLIAVIAVFGLVNVNAQSFKLGVTAGLPAADAADISSFVLGIDAYYYFTNIDSFIAIGGTAGFRNFFGDEITVLGQKVDFDDQQFLPLAVAGRLKLFGIVNGGADLGYAIGISDAVDGGFYLRPIIGIDIADKIELNVSYETIFDDATWGNLNAGILYQF